MWIIDVGPLCDAREVRAASAALWTHRGRHRHYRHVRVTPDFFYAATEGSAKLHFAEEERSPRRRISHGRTSVLRDPTPGRYGPEERDERRASLHGNFAGTRFTRTLVHRETAIRTSGRPRFDLSVLFPSSVISE